MKANTERWHGDNEYEDHVLTEVRKQGAHYELRVDSLCFGIDDPGWAPKAGDTVRYFGRGFGSVVRGVVVFPAGERSARTVFYRTQAEQRQLGAEQNARVERERQQELDEQRESRDLRWAALPEPFRRRMSRFFAGNVHWRRDYEPYELFCCEQAYAIAEALKASGKGTTNDLRAFAQLSFEQQHLIVPAIDDGHSGNTLGMAIRLAGWWLSKPENVVLEHGAMVPLVGCKEYGCTHPA